MSYCAGCFEPFVISSYLYIMNIQIVSIGLVGFLVILNSCQYNVDSMLYGTSDCPAIEATYQSHISGIIDSECAGCHSGNNPAAGLALTNYDQVVAAVSYSGLTHRIQLPLSDPDVMPPNGGLDACELDAILNWVESGSPY